MAPTPRGRFVWYDLMTPDPTAVLDFYQQVIGWTTAAWADPNMPYTMWKHGDTTIGGVMVLPEEARAQGAPPHWLCYIGTPDIGATVDAAKQGGAKVSVPPRDIPTVGSFAILADPQGASFATFSGDHRGGDWDPQVGDISWHELTTSDNRAALEFYGKLYDWQSTGEFEMGPGAIYQLFGQNGVPYGGMSNFMPGMPPIAHWMPYFRIGDLVACIDKVRELGGQVMAGPMEVPGGDTVGVCMDPQGAAFGLHQRKAD